MRQERRWLNEAVCGHRYQCPCIKPPIEWEEIIINEYGLSGTELEDFREAFFDAKNSESIDISRMAASDKELMLSFARQFDSIDKMAIKRLLENKRED